MDFLVTIKAFLKSDKRPRKSHKKTCKAVWVGHVRKDSSTRVSGWK